ncbi:MAG: SpoIIE family protein phosphatase [Clostridia bacterium]|nr:SpoIIE family protein phosphatase [Clostridia bacterium]
MQEQQTQKTNGKSRTKGEPGPSASAVLWRARTRAVGIELLWACIAWVFGQAEMLFGTYPLGLALLCGSARHTEAILAGLLITSVANMRDPVIYVCTYLAAALIRVFASVLLDVPEARVGLPSHLAERLAQDEDGIPVRQTRLSRFFHRYRSAKKGTRGHVLWSEWRDVFNESIVLRMIAAALGALIVGLYYAIAGGFQYYDLFAAVFAVIFCPVAVMVYSVALGTHTKFAWMTRLSEASLLLSLVFAARTVTFLSFPLSPMVALFVSLYVSHTRGIVQGSVAALLSGFALDVIHAPAFLLAALVYLFFKKLERENLAVLLACVAGLSWSVYVAGAGALLQLAPTFLIAGTAFTATQRLLLRERKETGGDEGDGRTVFTWDRTRYRDSNDRFRGISDAFSSLSEIFYNLSDRFRRPGTLDLRRICDDSFDAFCADCPNKTVCWGLEYSTTLATTNALISHLHTRGRVSEEQIAEHLRRRCSRMDGILSQINRECARLTGEMLRNNRTEIFAMDYEAAAAIINDALEEDDGEYRFDAALERRVAEYLRDAGVRYDGVTVYGKRRRRILIRAADIEHARVTAETLRSDLGEMCASELGDATFEVDGGVSTMVLQAKQKISVTGAQRNVSADGGVSGDTVNLFSNKKEYFYALISDGMGSGKEAALTSGICSVFLEKMLRAGNRAGTSLKMLNNMISSRGADSTRECSSTVDLLELDLMTGEGTFIKSGAAPSFVVRGNTVQRLQAGTVPIGIICTLDAQTTAFELREGDVVVMISDGIVESDPDCKWLTGYLGGIAEKSEEEIVTDICNHATAEKGHDDCSAVALKIGKNGPEP